MKWWLVFWGWSCVVMGQELLLPPMELTPEVRAEIQAMGLKNAQDNSFKSLMPDSVWDSLRNVGILSD
jgi:hypothetical protein